MRKIVKSLLPKKEVSKNVTSSKNRGWHYHSAKPLDCTREEAFEKGLLIDISPDARKMGLEVPIAASFDLYANYICPPDSDPQQREISLYNALRALKKLGSQSDVITAFELEYDLEFEVAVGIAISEEWLIEYSASEDETSYPEHDITFGTVSAKAVFDKVDHGEPVITLKLAHE